MFQKFTYGINCIVLIVIMDQFVPEFTASNEGFGVS
jgi:hypothetical protein